ncbi:MAG: rhodanese-like domain-containing protein [Phycisphaeraceae bacterium]|nr:rhodanese-like domain-containing protein [Phycisphaeraceae bacterium]
MNRPSESVFAFFLAVGLLALFVGGCNRGITDDRVSTVGFGHVRDVVAQRDGAVILLDVRRRSDFAEAHIPGAINIPLAEIRAGDPRLSGVRSIVVYGQTGEDRLSLAAAKKLKHLGYRNVVDYRPGLEEWIRHDAPLVVRPRERDD